MPTYSSRHLIFIWLIPVLQNEWHDKFIMQVNVRHTNLILITLLPKTEFYSALPHLWCLQWNLYPSFLHASFIYRGPYKFDTFQTFPQTSVSHNYFLLLCPPPPLSLQNKWYFDVHTMHFVVLIIHTNKCRNMYIKIFYRYSYMFQCFSTILRES